MAYQTLLTGQDGAAFVIRLNRPDKRNALSFELMGELMAALAEGEALPDARAVIITGTERFFSSGADLNEAVKVKTPAEVDRFVGTMQRMNGAIEALKKPVFAAIEGACFTGGLEMALACDIRISGAGGTFAITSARIGTVAGAGGTQRLPRLVGIAKAKELLFAAEPISADEALRIGLLNHVVPTGGALAKAQEMVAVYEHRGPISLDLLKRAVNQGMQMDLTSAIEYEKSLVTIAYGTEDKQEGISAFLEKRQARFKGR